MGRCWSASCCQATHTQESRISVITYVVLLDCPAISKCYRTGVVPFGWAWAGLQTTLNQSPRREKIYPLRQGHPRRVAAPRKILYFFTILARFYLTQGVDYGIISKWIEVFP